MVGCRHTFFTGLLETIGGLSSIGSGASSSFTSDMVDVPVTVLIV